MKVRIFTDGACSGNPGPGGYAAIINKEKTGINVAGYELNTTNNRMELLGVIEGLKFLSTIDFRKYDEIEIHSDSAYVVNAITKGWLKKWKINNWKTSSNDDVKNKDLWIALHIIIKSLTKAGIEISFIKVKGHNGNTFNEAADELAKGQVLIAKKVLEEQCKEGDSL